MGKTEVGLWFAGPGWKEGLPHLRGLELLPIGAAGGGKVPVDPGTGNMLGDWQRRAPYTPEQIAGFNGHVTGCGLRTGNGIVVFDIDGASAIEWLQARGFDPHAAPTWQVHRTTDPHRFKLIWRLSAEQLSQFPNTKLLLRTKKSDRSRRIKGEAVEVYAQPGAQVVILGPHLESGGFYGWKGTPADIATPDDTWFDALIAVKEAVAELRGKGDPSRPPRRNGAPSLNGAWRAFGQRNPCIICGRDHSAACTYSTSGEGRQFISCYYGATFTPPAGLKRLDVVRARDGSEWVHLYDYAADGIGDKALFMNHIPRPSTPPPMPSSPQPQQPQQPQQVPAQQLESTIKKPAPDKLKQTLYELISDGLSGSALQAEISSLSYEYGIDATQINRLVRDIKTEVENDIQLTREEQAIKSRLSLKQRRANIKLESIFPADVANALRTIQEGGVYWSDDMLTALGYLVSASSAIRLGMKIAANKTAWKAHPSLWLAIVADSGSKKSPYFDNFVRNPRKGIRAEYQRINERRMADYTQACIDAADTKGKPPQQPNPVRADIEKGTMQGIYNLLEAHQEERLSLLINPAELKVIFSGLNQFTRGKGGDQQEMLVLWDGSGSPTVFATKADRTATDWQVSICGCIQDAVLDGQMKGGDEDGLMARMLICPLPKRKLRDYREPSDQDIIDYHSAESVLSGAMLKLYTLDPKVYLMNRQAREHLHLLDQITVEMIESEDNSANRSVLGKRLAHIVRLAGVIHLLHVAYGTFTPDQEITLHTVLLAQELVDICQRYAMDTNARLALTGDDEGFMPDLMEKIVRNCKGKWMGVGQFHSRCLTAKQKLAYPQETIKRYMDKLVEMGLGHWSHTPSRNGAFSFTSTGSLP